MHHVKAAVDGHSLHAEVAAKDQKEKVGKKRPHKEVTIEVVAARAVATEEVAAARPLQPDR